MSGRKRNSSKGAPALGFDLAMLGWDAAQVIGLRTARLMQGGAAARKEADRMVAEKLVAMAELPWVMAGKKPEAATRAAVAHLARKVKANRRRLGRGGGKSR